MEKKSRRKFSSAFKSKVALEAAKVLKTINEIASSYGLQPAQVSEWKRTLLENMSEVFEKEDHIRCRNANVRILEERYKNVKG